MITYRVADENDYPAINSFYNKINKTNRTLEQFYWEFINSPYGKAVYVIALDGAEIIGSNAAIPIKIMVQDKEILTAKSEDTLVNPKYRGKKIFFNIYMKLFEECQKSNIDIIWGFTSAIKPFKKVGFNVPFSFKQVIVANKWLPCYNYLSSLNPGNKLLDKIKIGLFSIYLSVKFSFHNVINIYLNQEFNIEKEFIVDKIPDDIMSFYQTINSKWDANHILYSLAFLNWRIVDNPYYKNVLAYKIIIDEKVLGVIIVNIKNKIAFIVDLIFSPELSDDVFMRVFRFLQNDLFKNERVFVIRDWIFETSHYNVNINIGYKKSGFYVLNKGMGFVWWNQSKIQNILNNFYLTRIASEGLV